jgi:hypothetical protein
MLKDENRVMVELLEELNVFKLNVVVGRYLTIVTMNSITDAKLTEPSKLPNLN